MKSNFLFLFPIDSWTDDLIRIYIETFGKTCVQFNIESPFEMMEFKNKVFSHEILLFFCWKSMGDENTRIKNITDCIKKYFKLLESPKEDLKMSMILKLFSMIARP